MSQLKLIGLSFLCGLSFTTAQAVKPAAQYPGIIQHLNNIAPLIYDAKRSNEDRLKDIREAQGIIQELQEAAGSPRISTLMFQGIHIGSITITECHREGIKAKLQKIYEQFEMQRQAIERQRQREIETERNILLEAIFRLDEDQQNLMREMLRKREES